MPEHWCGLCLGGERKSTHTHTHIVSISLYSQNSFLQTTIHGCIHFFFGRFKKMQEEVVGGLVVGKKHTGTPM